MSLSRVRGSLAVRSRGGRSAPSASCWCAGRAGRQRERPGAGRGWLGTDTGRAERRARGESRLPGVGPARENAVRHGNPWERVEASPPGAIFTPPALLRFWSFLRRARRQTHSVTGLSLPRGFVHSCLHTPLHIPRCRGGSPRPSGPVSNAIRASGSGRLPCCTTRPAPTSGATTRYPTTAPPRTPAMSPRSSPGSSPTTGSRVWSTYRPLRAGGFVVEGRPPLMACRPGEAVEPPAVAGVAVAVVTADGDLHDVAVAQHAAYAEPEPPGPADVARLRATVDRGGVVALARDTGTTQPVGGGLCAAPVDGVSELAAVGVIESHRRRGIATAVTALLTRSAHARGARLVWLEPAGEREAAVYARVGFRPDGHKLWISLPGG